MQEEKKILEQKNKRGEYKKRRKCKGVKEHFKTVDIRTKEVTTKIKKIIFN